MLTATYAFRCLIHSSLPSCYPPPLHLLTFPPPLFYPLPLSAINAQLHNANPFEIFNLCILHYFPFLYLYLICFPPISPIFCGLHLWFFFCTSILNSPSLLSSHVIIIFVIITINIISTFDLLCYVCNFKIK